MFPSAVVKNRDAVPRHQTQHFSQMLQFLAVNRAGVIVNFFSAQRNRAMLLYSLQQQCHPLACRAFAGRLELGGEAARNAIRPF